MAVHIIWVEHQYIPVILESWRDEDPWRTDISGRAWTHRPTKYVIVIRNSRVRFPDFGGIGQTMNMYCKAKEHTFKFCLGPLYTPNGPFCCPLFPSTFRWKRLLRCVSQNLWDHLQMWPLFVLGSRVHYSHTISGFHRNCHIFGSHPPFKSCFIDQVPTLIGPHDSVWKWGIPPKKDTNTW